MTVGLCYLPNSSMGTAPIRLEAIRSCCFVYDPWRTRPKICQFPSSVFTRCKSTEKEAEFAKCEAIRTDMRLLGMKYGQIEKTA